MMDKVTAALTDAERATTAGFHENTLEATPRSLEYFASILHQLEARKLLTTGSANVSRVAYQMGYLSPSQFSREYKSMFGNSPITDLKG